MVKNISSMCHYTVSFVVQSGLCGLIRCTMGRPHSFPFRVPVIQGSSIQTDNIKKRTYIHTHGTSERTSAHVRSPTLTNDFLLAFNYVTWIVTIQRYTGLYSIQRVPKEVYSHVMQLYPSVESFQFLPSRFLLSPTYEPNTSIWGASAISQVPFSVDPRIMQPAGLSASTIDVLE